MPFLRRTELLNRGPQSVDRSQPPPYHALLNRHPYWWVALVLGVIPIAFRQVSVSDAWWHAAIGRWLLLHCSLPDLSKFYFSPFDAGRLASDLRWTWLGDIVLFLLYALAGPVGLQCLVIGCVVLALVFLARLAPHSRSPWTILLLITVCLGTYQLQLARNAVFSLALYPALLWICLRGKGLPTLRDYVLIGGILIIWSCLHGSCVLGWTTALLIIGTRVVVTCARGTEGQTAGSRLIAAVRPIFTCGVLLFVILLAILAGRQGAIDFLTLPVRHLWPPQEAAAAGNSQPVASQPTSQVNEKAYPAAKSLKVWLNRSIWKPDAREPWSNDFWSPFDFPGMRPIEVAFALTAGGLFCAVLFHNVPIGLLLAWAGAVFLGLGYVRMTGYMALASAAVILVATSRILPKHFSIVQGIGWTGVGLWMLFAWTAMLTGQCEKLIPEGLHVSRFGQIPIYDDAVADWVKSEFPKEKVFTTIETGSYCLLRWGFEKQVFLDGFFAPHTSEVWDGYNTALDSGSIAVIHDRIGMTVAIIPTTSVPWIDRFRKSPDWKPAAIGNGCSVFVHRSIPLEGRSPMLFANADELRKTTPYFRYNTLRTVFLITAAEIDGGFKPGEWTRQPNFSGLHDLAANVFPRM